MTLTDDQLDAAIDAVAQEMTAGDPADASRFRRRVLDGIDTGSTRRRAWRSAWVVPSLAAAAAVAIAVLVFRGGLEPTVRPPAPRSSAQNESGSGPAPRSSTQNDRSDTTGLPTTDGPRRTKVRLEPNTASASRDPSSLAPAALTVDPIGIDPIGVERLPPAESIRLDRLTPIAPIDVTPIGPDDPQRREQ